MNTTIAIDPHAYIDLARSKSTIQINVNLTNAPPINGFEVTVSYQIRWVLQASKIDYSNNIFSSFSSATVFPYCLDGTNPDGHQGLCESFDGPGFTSFGMTALGGLTANHTSGNLFTITFNVNTTVPAFSQIQITQATLGNGQIDPNTEKAYIIPVQTVDGYYTSRSCGGVPCAPASAAFTWSPQPPRQGNVTIFYGNASRPSPGYAITDYFWTFGDTVCTRGCTTPYADTKKNSTASYLYVGSGTYPVTLRITDDSGVVASKTIQVVVINANKIIGIESLDIQPSAVGVLPGQVFTITAVLRNYGGVTVNASMTLTLAIGQPKLLGSLPLASMKPSTTRTLVAKWDSKGYIPNVYRIDAFTPVLVNQTSTDKNRASAWVLLIYPSGGGLSLLGAAGIAVVAVGAGGYGVSFLRKRNLPTEDEL